MGRKDFSARILVSITGNKDSDWQSKLAEIKKYKITKVALFVECFTKVHREKIYAALLKSNIKQIPLVHIRHDTTKDELKFLTENFGSKYFTIHEEGFNHLTDWKGYYKNLFLEMNTDNFVSKKVKVEKIGGFCIDLSHFKVDEKNQSEEFKSIAKKMKNRALFACNHLNGYSYSKNTDVHTINNLNEFDYLTTLPKVLFGKVIGIETYNSIAEQLKFKKYVVKLLENKN
ncbi:MAG: hypothetical protein AABW48_05965 [Nanoarchaeota archaeon]